MSRKHISLSYLKDLKTDSEKEEFYNEYNHARGVLLKLREILKEKQESSYSHQLKANNYELPAWSENQADAIGYQRALNEVIKNLLPYPVGEEK